MATSSRCRLRTGVAHSCLISRRFKPVNKRHTNTISLRRAGPLRGQHGDHNQVP